MLVLGRQDILHRALQIVERILYLLGDALEKLLLILNLVESQELHALCPEWAEHTADWALPAAWAV